MVHAHTYIGAIIAREIKKTHKLPFIVKEHYTGWIDGTIREYHLRKGIDAFTDANIVTAVSKSLAYALEEQIQKAVVVTPNFIDAKIFRYRSENIIKKPMKGLFNALIIGDLISRKQVGHAIRSISLINKKSTIRVGLEIIGSGPLKGQLQTLVESLGQQENIVFSGTQSKEDIAKKLNEVDLLIHSSKIETFGLVILESLFCGTPVVSYNNGGVNEMAGLPGLIICKSSTVQNMVDKIENILTGSDSIDRQLISVTARKKFGEATIITHLNELYKKLLV